jgi:hypothetical protein
MKNIYSKLTEKPAFGPEGTARAVGSATGWGRSLAWFQNCLPSVQYDDQKYFGIWLAMLWIRKSYGT